MVSAVDAFIGEPSIKSFYRWRNIAKGYSDEYLSSNEQQAFRELVKDHEIISDDFRSVLKF